MDYNIKNGFEVCSGKVSPTAGAGAEDQEVEEKEGQLGNVDCASSLRKGEGLEEDEDDEMELKFFTPQIIQGEGSHHVLDVNGQNLLNNMASVGGGISVAGSVASGSGASGRSVTQIGQQQANN